MLVVVFLRKPSSCASVTVTMLICHGPTTPTTSSSQDLVYARMEFLPVLTTLLAENLDYYCDHRYISGPGASETE